MGRVLAVVVVLVQALCLLLAPHIAADEGGLDEVPYSPVVVPGRTAPRRTAANTAKDDGGAFAASTTTELGDTFVSESNVLHTSPQQASVVCRYIVLLAW